MAADPYRTAPVEHIPPVYVCDDHSWFGYNEPSPDCDDDYCSGRTPLYPGDSTYWCGHQVEIRTPEPCVRVISRSRRS